MYLVLAHFCVSVINNMTPSLNIAMPLHMIFRSGALVANMALGIVVLKKVGYKKQFCAKSRLKRMFFQSYSREKFASVLMISVGIAACTIRSGTSVSDKGGH